KAPAPGLAPGSSLKRLKERLPQQYDVWQADFLQMPTWIGIASQPVRPWAILVTSATNDLVLAHQMAEEPPSGELLWDTLVHAMQQPAAGEPHRPTEIQVRSDERWQALRPH